MVAKAILGDVLVKTNSNNMGLSWMKRQLKRETVFVGEIMPNSLLGSKEGQREMLDSEKIVM